MPADVKRRTMLTGLGATAVGTGAVAGAAPASAGPGTHRHRGDRPLIGRARPGTLHVMNYNVRLSRITKTHPGEPDHWPDRRPLLIELVNREHPTILGVEEMKFNQISALEEALPRHRMIGFARKGGSDDEYSAIFYDRTRLELLGWNQFWLSDTPQEIGSIGWGSAYPRIVVWARLKDNESGTEFAHINTHFDNKSDPARVKSAEAMIDLFDGGELDGLPAVITGDFNSPAHDSGGYTTLVTEGPTRDVWDEAKEQLTPAWGTWPNYAEPVEGGDRIDWILVTEEWGILEAGINVWRGEGGAWPSDHAPMQALISLP
jgi:endonuclease/exonuclease/phosphatase family metal-dependent hydrolase